MILQSLGESWLAGSKGESEFLKLLRSALFVLNNTGSLRRAVRYLVDLHAHGAAPEEDSLARVIGELVWARACVESDSQVVTLLLMGRLPESADDWTKTLESLPNLRVPRRIDSWPSAARGELGAFTEMVLSEIGSVRLAVDYDEWWSQRIRVAGLARIAGNVFGHELYDGNRRPVALEALLSDFEEIECDLTAWTQRLPVPPPERDDLHETRARAMRELFDVRRDADSFRGLLVERLTAPTLAQELDYVRAGIRPAYEAAAGDSWAERLAAKRLLVPGALGPHCVLDPDYEAPATWQGLSARLAHPYTALFQPSLHPAQVPRPRYTALNVLAANRAEFEAYLGGLGLDSESQLGFVSWVLQLLNSGYDPRLRAVEHPDVPSGTTRAWRSLAADPESILFLMKGVRQGYTNLAYQRVMLHRDRIIAASTPSGRLRAAEGALAEFPWNDDFALFRSMAHLEMGQPRVCPQRLPHVRVPRTSRA